MRAFLQTWFTGYLNPAALVEALRSAPAPHWGLYAVLTRGALDALGYYLPLTLLGWQPATPSYLTFLPTERYYAALMGIAPLFFLLQWLFLSAALHLALRLSGRPGGLDQILNLTGMASLVVGAFLIPWDWLWVALGPHSDVALGISHLLLDLWAITITTLGLRRLLGLPLGLALLLNLLWIGLGLPLAILFMRGPF